MAQFPIFSGSEGPSEPHLPVGVRRLGFIEVAPVRFEDHILIEVVAPTVRDRASPGDQIPVEERARQVEINLERVIAFDANTVNQDFTLETLFDSLRRQNSYITNFDPDTLQVSISKLNGATILQAVDDYRSTPQPLVTVTELDANYHVTTIEKLAERWQGKLYDALVAALQERLPTSLREKTIRALLIVAGTIALSLLIWLLQRFFRHRDRALKEKLSARMAVTGEAANHENEENFAMLRLAFLANMEDEFSLTKQRKLLSLILWGLFWFQILIWVGGMLWALYLFPWTRGLSSQVVHVPVISLLILFIASLADRICDDLLARAMHAWAESNVSIFGLEDLERRSLRAKTLTRVLAGLTTLIFYGLAVIWILQVIGLPANSVLAGGAIIGLAISFGAQNLVKDLVNGVLILWEDQYAVGDVIVIGEAGGLVENMNLRITQLRNGEGRLITIPNSAITQVENLTRSWSRVDFTIEVAYDTKIQDALAIIRQVAETMYDEPVWHERIIDPPEVLGVDSVTHAGMLIRVWIKTQPLEQWSVGREFRLRVRIALEENGIDIGRPQQIFYHAHALDGMDDKHANGNTSRDALPSSASAPSHIPKGWDEE
jgi:small conductance mechanosensitive channel